MGGEISSGKLYYQKHRAKNLEAVKDYRSRHLKQVSNWNREYYKQHRTSEEPYCARYKYDRWSPFHYIDDETFMRNMKELTLYYMLHFTDKLSLHTYKKFFVEW